MKILLVNDDSITGVGLIALVKELYGKHEIYVVAPKHECSGNSHTLNFRVPITVTKTTIPGYEDVPAWHVDGSPADCTRIALKVILKDNMPDIVLSGINRGPNMGVNILWSGTTNAATQATLHGVRALAFSPKALFMQLSLHADWQRWQISSSSPSARSSTLTSPT